jgi:hypothetical protein
VPIEEVRKDQHVFLHQVNLIRPPSGVLQTVQDIPSAGNRRNVRAGVKQKSLREIKVANDLELSEAGF